MSELALTPDMSEFALTKFALTPDISEFAHTPTLTRYVLALTRYVFDIIRYVVIFTIIRLT